MTTSALSPVRELCYVFLELPNGKQKEIKNQLGDWAENSFRQDAKVFFFALYDAAKENKKLDELWNKTMAISNSEKGARNPFTPLFKK